MCVEFVGSVCLERLFTPQKKKMCVRKLSYYTTVRCFCLLGHFIVAEVYEFSKSTSNHPSVPTLECVRNLT